MSKRRLENSNNSQSVNIYGFSGLNNEYYNELNCDSIKIINNRIIFHSSITNFTIEKLFEFIKIIIESPTFDRNFNRIYLHIISIGGTLDALNDFINIKKNHYTSIEFVSVIENTCSDAGFMLAALCNYRIIKKNVICYMSPINNNNKYWGIYLQDQNLLNNLSNVILNCKLKISTIKFNKYLIQNNIWNAKKMLKIGLMDEII
tara:strand:- start:4903 stop:5514 length:612 start_codon:yes stop_codon:yes gene_type:complete